MLFQKNKRKNYFIKKDFQKKFILKFCALVVLGSVISGAILYLLSRGTVTTAFVNARLSIITTADYILPALIGSSLITIILITLATVVVVMYLSHRIAGPLFKIERSTQEFGKGNLNLKINLRSTDQIKETADCFNQMAENIKAQLLKIKAKSNDLDNEISALTSLSKDKDASSEKMQEALKKVFSKNEELHEAIDYFKTGDKS